MAIHSLVVEIVVDLELSVRGHHECFAWYRVGHQFFCSPGINLVATHDIDQHNPRVDFLLFHFMDGPFQRVEHMSVGDVAQQVASAYLLLGRHQRF